MYFSHDPRWRATLSTSRCDRGQSAIKKSVRLRKCNECARVFELLPRRVHFCSVTWHPRSRPSFLPPSAPLFASLPDSPRGPPSWVGTEGWDDGWAPWGLFGGGRPLIPRPLGRNKKEFEISNSL